MAGSVIAKRGEGTYLINVGDGDGAILLTKTDPPQLFPPKLIDSHLKMGYWEPFNDDPAPVIEALSRAEHQGDPAQQSGYEALRPEPRLSDV